MSIFDKYEKQFTKARIDRSTAERINSKVGSPAMVFPIIDSIFMKAKFSGLTKDQILAIIDAGVFSTIVLDAPKLIALKPYLKYWPNDPSFAHLVLRAGISPEEIDVIGIDNIKRDVLETMIALK